MSASSPDLDIEPDFDEADAFIAALTSPIDTPMAFRTWTEDKTTRATAEAEARARGEEWRDPLAKNYVGTLRELWRKLVAANRQGAGVFLVINAGSHGEPVHRDADVAEIRSLFVDDDSGQLDPTTISPPPSIVVKTRQGCHVYWLLEPGEPITAFRPAQARLIHYNGTDKRIINESRVMRLPGFFHVKDADAPLMIRARLEPDRRYTMAEVIKFYPPLAPRPVIERPSVVYEDGRGESDFLAWCDRIGTDDGTRNNNLFRILTEGRGRVAADVITDATVLEALLRYRERSGVGRNEGAVRELHAMPWNGPYEAHLPAKCHRTADEARAEPDEPTPEGNRAPEADERPAKRRTPDSIAAAAIAPELKDLYRYYHGSDQWYRYDAGGAWRVVASTIAWADVVLAIDRLELAPSGYSAPYPAGVFNLLRQHLGVTQFSRETGFHNGLLRDGELTPHSPAHLLIHVLPYDYDPAATCEPILAWLDAWMSRDRDVIHILRSFMFAVLHGMAHVQVFLELLGPGGSGKGTFVRLLTMLVGEHSSCATELKRLEENRFEAALVRDKRLIQINDSDRYGGSVSLLKRITGDDEIPHEQKHRQQTGSFRASGMVVITANEAIKSSDYTSGLARRRITVRAENQIDMAEARDLEAEFAPHMSGLWNWVAALDGEQAARDLRTATRKVAAIAAARDSVELETNPVAAWAAERLHYLVGARTKVGAAKRISGKAGESAAFFENSDIWLYPSYCDWAQGAGVQPLGQWRFVATLKDLLVCQYGLAQVSHKTMAHGAHFIGVALSAGGGSSPIGAARAFVREVRDLNKYLTPGDEGPTGVC
jgi:phage/plasmid-associated DNA primase